MKKIDLNFPIELNSPREHFFPTKIILQVLSICCCRLQECRRSTVILKVNAILHLFLSSLCQCRPSGFTIRPCSQTELTWQAVHGKEPREARESFACTAISQLILTLARACFAFLFGSHGRCICLGKEGGAPLLQQALDPLLLLGWIVRYETLKP